MSKKRHTAEEIVAKLRQVDVLTAQGRTVAEAIRQIGVTEVTYYRWRNEYGGLKSGQVKRLKELEAEDARLRRAVSDLTLDKMILKEAAKGNISAPPAAVPVWITSELNWVCPSDGSAGFSASIAPRKPQDPHHPTSLRRLPPADVRLTHMAPLLGPFSRDRFDATPEQPKASS